MSDTDGGLLQETVRSLLADACPDEVVRAAERGSWPSRLWQLLEDSGLTLVGIDEKAGGSGGSVRDLAVVLRAAGQAAAPVPLAENALAGWLRATVGLPIERGPATVAWGWPAPGRGGPPLRGTARAVPWLLEAHDVVVLAADDDGACHVLTGTASAEAVHRSRNLAGEPRDDVDLSQVTVSAAVRAPAWLDVAEIRLRGAFARSVTTVGALDRVLELSVRYAGEREQFGRPISRFQAVAQMTATLAAEVAAAAAATAVATDALDVADNAQQAATEIAIAKTRTGRAAKIAAAIGHQIHGAIGCTAEYPLQLVTRRALAWRDEYGTDREWALRLGRTIGAGAAQSLWERLAPL